MPPTALGDGGDILGNPVDDKEVLKTSKLECDVSLFEVWGDGGQQYEEWIRRRTEEILQKIFF